jgi:hypothetical protein
MDASIEPFIQPGRNPELWTGEIQIWRLTGGNIDI